MNQLNSASPIEIVVTGGTVGDRLAAIDTICRTLDPHMDVAVSYDLLAPEFSPDDISAKLQRERSRREDFQHAIQVASPEASVIIYERGICDAACGVSRSDFLTALRHQEMSLSEARDSYTAVIIVEAPGNEATESAWLGHPHLFVASPLSTEEERLETIARHATGLDGNLEIERKFLLREIPDTQSPPLDRALYFDILQTYLTSKDPRVERRLRMRQGEGETMYFLTQKRDVGNGTREEHELTISQREYKRLLHDSDPRLRPIRKRRYCFLWQRRQVELDVYISPPRLAVAEVELEAITNAPLLPPTLNVAREVTDDPDYRNSNLARRTVANASLESDSIVAGF
jgi:CYTH domain-containing protein